MKFNTSSLTLILLLFTSLTATTSTRNPLSMSMFQQFEVHIINNFNESNGETGLIVHCKSGDDDLGDHYLWQDQDLHWKFRINFVRSTLFFCNINCGETTTGFTVFDTDSISIKCQDSSKCFWSVREEGFYLSCDGNTYEKQHEWP